MKILNNILESIGKTPIIKLDKINDSHADIYVKLESTNPGGSIKDRAVFNMIDTAEKDGSLKKGDVIIEATSGNTGIGLAMVCAVYDYDLIIVMPDCVSVERKQLMEAYGAKVVLTCSENGMKGCLETVEELKIQNPNHFTPNQFLNQENPNAHFNTTGREIWEDLNGEVDVFICGTGTGGSFSGTSKYLKSQNSNVYTVAVEPMRAPFISKGITGPHDIQGMGMSAGFIPETFHSEVMDEITTVSFEDSKLWTNKLARKEGILAGVSSGANVAVAMELAKRPENKGKKIVTIIMDTGERYLSSNIFE